jgi:glycosyltransferase involved in cell wall biosynthesis
VDDCSADPTSEVAQQRPWVDVLRHPVNLGQGAALQTGIEHALARGAEIIVTFDSDGQHRIEDIPALLAPLRRGEADVALGSRFLAPDQSALVQIPARRRAVLRMAAVYTRFTTGLPVTDAHNGLRAFTAAAARRVQIHQNRMAHASEILAQIASNRLRLVEVPVVIRYTPYSLAKGQRLSNALNILWDLLLGHIRR